MYDEIKALYEYCKKIGVQAVLSSLYDGYKITFKNGGDFVQHSYSYWSDIGCVEPAIHSKIDYTAVPLKRAKLLVKRHKERLNKEL